jgi:hypothetical protein
LPHQEPQRPVPSVMVSDDGVAAYSWIVQNELSSDGSTWVAL